MPLLVYWHLNLHSINNENLGAIARIMAPKFVLFTKGSMLPLNKGFKNMFEMYYSLALNPRFAIKYPCWKYFFLGLFIMLLKCS